MSSNNIDIGGTARPSVSEEVNNQTTVKQEEPAEEIKTQDHKKDHHMNQQRNIPLHSPTSRSFSATVARRQLMEQRYTSLSSLKSLLLQPPEVDGASIIDDAMTHIRFLQERVHELGYRILTKMESSDKLEDTFVYACVINGRANILIKRRGMKKICQLHLLARIIDDLQLEVIRFSRSTREDCYIYNFLTKVIENSEVSQSVISEKIMELL